MIYEYEKDDYIVYDTYGVCKIKEIKKMSFIHGTPIKDYYVLSPENNPQSTYYVPCESETLVSKIRRPLSKESIEEILQKSYSEEFLWIENRQLRAEKAKEIISCGITPSLISLIRCFYERKVQLLEKGKKLSSTDESILSSAEKLINEEFAFSLNIRKDAVPDFIRNTMDEVSA